MSNPVQAGAMTVEWQGLDELHDVLAELAAMGEQGAIAYIGTNLTDPPYPYFLEYGTSRMPAYPAARPAFDERRLAAQETVRDVLAQLIGAGRRDPEIMRLAAGAGALEVANRWKELARVRTGTYRRSIHVETEMVPNAATAIES